MKRFRITNGQNIISIGLSSIGDYLNMEHPVTLAWADCGGSIARYLCQLPYGAGERQRIKQLIINYLYDDFTDKLEDLYDLLAPLLQMLENGAYELRYHASKNAYIDYPNADPFYDGALGEVFFAKHLTHKKLYDQLPEKEKTYLHLDEFKNEIDYKTLINNKLEYLLTDLYYTYAKIFLATEPEINISEERVQFFMAEINAGKRPFALIFNANVFMQEAQGDCAALQYSHDYILDGHHKLLAYNRLKISPAIIEITQKTEKKNRFFDLEKLVSYLYPWHIQHILKNWDEKTAYLEKVLQNPNSPLHPFQKKGWQRGYFPNDCLKYEVFYVDDKIMGCARTWYVNGQLATEYQYDETGKRTGKEWYEDGTVRLLITNVHESVYYANNGQLLRKQSMIDDKHWLLEE
jgi:YD repeat-containing protein